MEYVFINTAFASFPADGETKIAYGAMLALNTHYFYLIYVAKKDLCLMFLYPAQNIKISKAKPSSVAGILKIRLIYKPPQQISIGKSRSMLYL